MDGVAGSEVGVRVKTPSRKIGIPAIQRRHVEEAQKPQEEEFTGTRFSQETRQALEGKGYRIFTLKGEALSEEEMVRFVSPFMTGEDAALFAQDKTQNSEIAIPPFRVIEESKDGTFDEQVELMKQYSQRVEEEIPGATAIIGEIADYVALEAQFQKDNKGKVLFKDGFVRSRTFIQKEGKDEKNLFLAEGDVVSYCNPNFKFEGMYIAPLIVPVRK